MISRLPHVRWALPSHVSFNVILTILLFCARASAQGDVLVMEADTSADMYVNSIFIRVDVTIPLLPMNNLRSQRAFGHTVKALRTPTPIIAGDVIGVKVRSTRSEIVPVTSPLGVINNYSGLSAVKVAFAPGTMSTAAWKCTQDHVEPESPDDDYVPWHSNKFNDTTWPQAVVQDRDCCPWRDVLEAWENLHADWISAPWYANFTNNRFFWCRYTIPPSGEAHPFNLTVEEGSRYPLRETENSTLRFSDAAGCQRGFRLLEGGCFKFRTFLTTYAEAQLECETLGHGGSLANIKNEKQNMALQAIVRTDSKPLIGPSDQQVEGEWRNAADGKVVTWTNFNVSNLEPNGGRDENCVAIFYDWPDGLWNDVPCESDLLNFVGDQASGFLCQSDACLDFSGNWITDEWGYKTQNLDQDVCAGQWIEEQVQYAVVSARLTLGSDGETAELLKEEKRDVLTWSDNSTWVRHRASPTVVIVSLILSQSGGQVTFNVSRRAQVSCNMIDARYFLRTPSALELEVSENTKLADPTVPALFVVGNASTDVDYVVELLVSYEVVIWEQCASKCMDAYPKCVLATFYETGSDLATGLNCRLASAVDLNNFFRRPNALHDHRIIQEMPVQHTMQIFGLVVPGVIYLAYCTTRDPYTGLHSTIESIRKTEKAERAKGAFDSGSLNKPKVVLMGGYVSTTSLVPVAKTSRPGRVFCSARTPDRVPTGNWTAKEIKGDGMFTISVIANASVPVKISDLQPNTVYEVACAADSDGGAESTLDVIQATRRRWHTEKKKPAISAMTVDAELSLIEIGTMEMNTFVQVTEVGYLWCLVVPTEVTLEHGTPRESTIRTDGLVQKVEDTRIAVAGQFAGLPSNNTYEAYCTAEANDFSNETDSALMRSPYPLGAVLRYKVREDGIQIWVTVDRGPSSVYCRAFEWAKVPTSRRPTTPVFPSGSQFLTAPREGDGKDLQFLLFNSPNKFNVLTVQGGVAVFDITPLPTGSWFDVYCYAEDLMEETPPGAEPPPRRGMTAEAIRKTRFKIQTKGPVHEEAGWHCVAGRPCNITGLQGVGLSGVDRVLARSDACPGICICAGYADPLRKGLQCSSVSQDVHVLAPLPGGQPDQIDPRGNWCYVLPGACDDEEPSELFPDLMLSYQVCRYMNVAGEFSHPPGFPKNGIAEQLFPHETIKFTFQFVGMDCQLLTQYHSYVLAFEANVKSSLLVSLGSKFYAKDLSFEYIPHTNYMECFVHALIAVPPAASAVQSVVNVKNAIDSWLPGDVIRRISKIVLIRKVFVGLEEMVTLKEITHPQIELDPVPGTAYGWGVDPFAPPGNAYHLCFCNGTESNCELEIDYRLEIGLLHVSGPTSEQATLTTTCVGGLPCDVSDLLHHSAANGSKIAVIPFTEAGCRWTRTSVGIAPGVPHFLGTGVSDPAVHHGSLYVWGSGMPLVVKPGVYIMCWCGPAVKRTRPIRATDVLYGLPGGIAEACPPIRPSDGVGFLAPAGFMRVTGPFDVGTRTCRIGLPCIVDDVEGEGIRGGDHVAILRKCGKEPPESDRFKWTTTAVPDPAVQTTTTKVTTTAYIGPGFSHELPKWVEGGWIEYGQGMTPEIESSIGIGGEPGRAMYGFPGRGISEPSARRGYYRWNGPLWAFAGEYQMCWCSTGSGDIDFERRVISYVNGEEWCSKPEHFLVPFGSLLVSGPGVLPRSSQIFQCVRLRGCEINDYEGTMPVGSKLLIAEGECGGKAKPGAPNEGQSLPSKDGVRFTWGQEPLRLAPGPYRLCWCAAVITCFSATDFAAYSGLISVKAPTASRENWFCQLGLECNISGISGYGLHNGDKIAVLVACGSGMFTTNFKGGGVSTKTYELGNKFLLPQSVMYGVFKVCWCAGENLCSRGEDYDTEVGNLRVGGPDASALYVCHEWQPCNILIQGAALNDNDMIRVVPAGTDCASIAASDNGPGPVDGFPRSGVAFPAVGGGHQYSFGDGLLRAPPAVYDLCYCNFIISKRRCSTQGGFITQGGSIRVGTSKEYQYATRPKDNEPRSNDQLYPWFLAILLPIVLAIAACLGWGRQQWCRRKGQKVEPETEAVNIFTIVRNFAESAQAKAKTMHQVRQILEIRLSSGAQVERQISRKKNGSPTSKTTIASVPNFQDEEEDDEAEVTAGSGIDGDETAHRAGSKVSLPSSAAESTGDNSGMRQGSKSHSNTSQERRRSRRKSIRRTSVTEELPPPPPDLDVFTNMRSNKVWEILEM